MRTRSCGVTATKFGWTQCQYAALPSSDAGCKTCSTTSKQQQHNCYPTAAALSGTALQDHRPLFAADLNLLAMHPAGQLPAQVRAAGQAQDALLQAVSR
jgi:hypothetical protein